MSKPNTSSKTGIPFDIRYPDRDKWAQISRRTRRMTKVCCWCHVNPAQEAHHVRYRDERGAIAGREIPGVDVFGVCHACHGRLHQSDAWIKDRADPVFGHHQSQPFVEKLKLGFNLLKNVGTIGQH